MPKRKPQTKYSSKLPFLLGVLLCAGAVWALADYVHVAHADKVPAYEHRPNAGSHRTPNTQYRTPNTELRVLVYTPVKDNAGPEATKANFTFSSTSEVVPADQDPIVFAVNEYLRNAKVTEPDAKLMGVDLNEGLAVLHFNSAMNHTIGEDNESYLLNGIDKTLAQFPEVQKVQYYAEGTPIETFGSVDLSQPLSVNETSALAHAKRLQKSAPSAPRLTQPSRTTKG